jgi:hypothetical protein
VEEEENGSPKYVVTPRTTVVEHDVHASVAGAQWIGQRRVRIQLDRLLESPAMCRWSTPLQRWKRNGQREEIR